MPNSKTVQRKKDHINICINGDVAFKTKTNGFENYEFEHNAATEVKLNEIDLSTKFFGKKISFPFVISCMTGGTREAGKINEKLALVANELNILIGVGSQRQALEDRNYHYTYEIIRKNAGTVPVLGNIGAAQIVNSKNVLKEIALLIDIVKADAMVIHVNPLQELLQKEGEPNFCGLLKKLEIICSKIKTPIIIKEVGSGISKNAAKNFLDAGVKGIDVAGSGGTSWAAVELLRNSSENNYLREWGLPTSYCVRTVAELKNKQSFTLISSGGINEGSEIAKSLALGADLCASARPLLNAVVKNNIDGAANLIESWFGTVKNIMYLTGCGNIKQLQKQKLIRRTEMF